MEHDVHHHEQLIESVTNEYREILENSKQGIYIYLDDVHKVCNDKLAKLMGYKSPGEWARVPNPFLNVMVAEASQEVLGSAYWKAMEQNVGSEIEVTWKKKDGGTVPSSVILVPISHEGHKFALHFISEK